MYHNSVTHTLHYVTEVQEHTSSYTTQRTNFLLGYSSYTPTYLYRKQLNYSNVPMKFKRENTLRMGISVPQANC